MRRKEKQMDFKDRIMQRADDLADARHNCGFYDMACEAAGRGKKGEDSGIRRHHNEC